MQCEAQAIIQAVELQWRSDDAQYVWIVYYNDGTDCHQYSRGLDFSISSRSYVYGSRLFDLINVNHIQHFKVQGDYKIRVTIWFSIAVKFQIIGMNYICEIDV